MGAGLHGRPARPRRSQECAADGGAHCARGSRAVAPLHRDLGVGSRAARDGVGARGRALGRRRRRRADHRRHVLAETGEALGLGVDAAVYSGQAGSGRIVRPSSRADAARRTTCRCRSRCACFSRRRGRRRLRATPAGGVPTARRAFRTKGEIALAEVDRIRATGVTFGTVLADAGYGASAEFFGTRSRLRALTQWAVGIGRLQKVFPAQVRVRRPRPTHARGRPRRYAVPSHGSRSVDQVLAPARWQAVSWRTGTRGPLRAQFAAVRVRVADGIQASKGQHLPGDLAWLVGERRATGERKYYLTNHPAGTPLRTLAAAIKARWGVRAGASATRQEELGLDHFEGRKLARPASPRAVHDARLHLPPAPTPAPAHPHARENGAGGATTPADAPRRPSRATPRARTTDPRALSRLPRARVQYHPLTVKNVAK